MLQSYKSNYLSNQYSPNLGSMDFMKHAKNESRIAPRSARDTQKPRKPRKLCSLYSQTIVLLSPFMYYSCVLFEDK